MSTSQIIYPEDKKTAGSHYWHVLFNIAAQYSDHPTRDDKINTHNLIKSIVSKFTCQDCISHAFDYMRKHPAELDNRESLMKWLCGLKNNANIHEGKEVIDCDQFLLNSLNRSGGCKSCTVEPIKAPSVSLNAKPTPVQVSPPSPMERHSEAMDDDFLSVWNWHKRYPSLKKSINIESDTNMSVGTPNEQNLESQYPSLAGLDSEFSRGPPQEEELDGIIKPLDSFYAIPARFLDIKPSEMNLAYTPELISNVGSLLTQMYLTNFGSLLTTFTTSLGLIGVSVFAKGALSHYDRLLVQNMAASLLFHSLNFINPRIREDLMPSLNHFIEGVTTMNFDKIKAALLYGADNSVEKEGDELMDMLNSRDGKVNMDKLMANPHMLANALAARDLQNASQYNTPMDLRTSGMSSTPGGAVTKDDLEKLFQSRRPLSRGTGVSNPNYSVLESVDNRYGYILDNALL